MQDATTSEKLSSDEQLTSNNGGEVHDYVEGQDVERGIRAPVSPKKPR